MAKAAMKKTKSVPHARMSTTSMRTVTTKTDVEERMDRNSSALKARRKPERDLRAEREELAAA